jgi:hypothetical protein
VATLRSRATGDESTVTSRLLIGRSPACGLKLSDPHVSGEHATLTWTGWHWELRDLGSRNGTFVDGTRLDPGAPVKLGVGARVAFGDPERDWELIDDEAPVTMAVNLALGTVRAAETGILVLPDEQHPELTIYQDATGEWVEESQEGTQRRLEDQATLETSRGSWVLHLPQVSEGTPLLQVQMSLEAVSIQFAVSRDEERVELTLIHRGREVALEPREHGYVLLTLARARLDDEALPPDQRGWRDRGRLEKMLAMDSNALNVAIHRARQQLSAAGVAGAVNIVEVRRKQRRLGTERFRVVPL